MATFTCSGLDKGNLGSASRVATSGWMSTMCAPPSIRAFVFREKRSTAFFSRHVQMKCFPFRGAALTDATLVSELLDRVLSAESIAPCEKMAATRSSAGVVHPLSTSVVAAMGGTCVPVRVFARSASASVRTL